MDLGGGVILANRPGGYYMGRLLVGSHFDRHGAWYFSEENQSNCTPPTSSAHGTEKVLLKDAPLFGNVSWTGGAMGYDGGPARDFVATIPAGTHVWYRYTTRDGQHIVALVPGTGWGFFPIGVLDRSRTGHWSFPTDPGTLHGC